VHMMPASQLPDRRSARSPVPPDLLEQLHPRPRHPQPPRRQQRRKDQNQGGAKIRDDTPPHHPAQVTTQAGPKFVTKTHPAGASSGDHTQAGDTISAPADHGSAPWSRALNASMCLRITSLGAVIWTSYRPRQPGCSPRPPSCPPCGPLTATAGATVLFSARGGPGLGRRQHPGRPHLRTFLGRRE